MSHKVNKLKLVKRGSRMSKLKIMDGGTEQTHNFCKATAGTIAVHQLWHPCCLRVPLLLDLDVEDDTPSMPIATLQISINLYCCICSEL